MSNWLYISDMFKMFKADIQNDEILCKYEHSIIPIKPHWNGPYRKNQLYSSDIFTVCNNDNVHVYFIIQNLSEEDQLVLVLKGQQIIRLPEDALKISYDAMYNIPVDIVHKALDIREELKKKFI